MSPKAKYFVRIHLAPKPQAHKDEKVLEEREEDEGDAQQDPLDKRTDLARGRDLVGRAVVQVDRHQQQGEEQAKSDDTKLHQQCPKPNLDLLYCSNGKGIFLFSPKSITTSHLPGTAST